MSNFTCGKPVLKQQVFSPQHPPPPKKKAQKIMSNKKSCRACWLPPLIKTTKKISRWILTEIKKTDFSLYWYKLYEILLSHSLQGPLQTPALLFSAVCKPICFSSFCLFIKNAFSAPVSTC